MEGIDWGEVIRIAVEALVAIAALFFRKKLGATTRTFTDIIEAAATTADGFDDKKANPSNVNTATRRSIESDMLKRLKRAIHTRTAGTGVGATIDTHKTASEKAMNGGT